MAGLSWCIDWQVRRFGEIDSTNTWLLDEARRGAPEGLVAVADHQTAGRGRLGRRWEAPPGANLLASVLLRPPQPSLPADRRHLVVAAVGLAARSACVDVAGVAPGLKWPNDLVVDGPGGGKLAGVLAEAEGDAVVVGIGLNVGWAPPEGACSLTSLGGAHVTPAAVLDALLAALAGLYSGPATDWAAVASAYRAACSTLGRLVRVELPDETFTGTAADVDDAGHLLVDTGTCLRTVTAADVVHLR